MRRLFLVLALFLGALPCAAQQASLIADRIGLDGTNRIIAQGNVQIFYEETTLTATRLIYDRAGDQLRIEGPIRLTEGDGTVILASDAELSGDLRRGILRSANLVLERRLQLAANEIRRVDERYTVLTRTVVSACEVCAQNPTPIWEIRADRVVQDAFEQQLYFDNAQIRLAGVPVFWVPRLRLPDPGLDRATGFLIPELRTLSEVGTGLKVPYFIRMGERADVTIAPYFATNSSTLETRYRQSLRNGQFSFSGAASNDAISDEGTRAYLFGEGEFALPRDYVLTFDIELVSDQTYLLEYDYSEKDRLDSEIAIARFRNDEAFVGSLTTFRTLRESDQPISDQLPGGQGRLFYARRLPTGLLGGDAWLQTQALSVSRESSDPIVGRDTVRAGVSLDWRRDWVTGQGMVIEAATGLQTDIYNIKEDPTFDGTVSRTTQRAALTFRWPHARTGAQGYSIFEPVIQLAWADTNGQDVPNDDSTLVDFDEGNLFSFSRFPGEDAVETGFRANVGATYWSYLQEGRRLGFAIGRVLRAEDFGQFSPGSGLDGIQSDWLAAAHLDIGQNLSIASRGLFDGEFSFSRNETRLAWQTQARGLAATYIYAIEDPANGRDEVKPGVRKTRPAIVERDAPI
ncbi:MAG: LPS assembly protein LptD, partial [Pseudomonadota bacterium]